METVVINRLTRNWKQKIVAIITAIVLWFFVNHSINETKTISNVPIRVINLPPDKTIQGLLPNGILSRRITLTLTGTKDVIEELESGDLEVLLDASVANQDEWVVQISKKSLISLNPSIDLAHHIKEVSHSDFVIKLKRLVTAKIPLFIETPINAPPQGYEYLDIWPQHLFQTLSGPEEEISHLKEKGLELTFNLKEISKSELDNIKSTGQNQHNDEISFYIPKKWKQIPIPFSQNQLEELNDPEAQSLHIDFLRKEFLPFSAHIPVRVFFPLDESDTINPAEFSITVNDEVHKKNGLYFLSIPLFAEDVSRLFIDVIRNNIEIVIIARPKEKREQLAWSLDFINSHELEDTYVALSIANAASGKGGVVSAPKKREELLRKRFRDYVQRLALYVSPQQKLHLKCFLDGSHVNISSY